MRWFLSHLHCFQELYIILTNHESGLSWSHHLSQPIGMADALEREWRHRSCNQLEWWICPDNILLNVCVMTNSYGWILHKINMFITSDEESDSEMICVMTFQHPVDGFEEMTPFSAKPNRDSHRYLNVLVYSYIYSGLYLLLCLAGSFSHSSSTLFFFL